MEIDYAKVRPAATRNSLPSALADLDGLIAELPFDNIADLDQTTSDPPTQVQVQAIATKVDAILAALLAAGLMAAAE